MSAEEYEIPMPPAGGDGAEWVAWANGLSHFVRLDMTIESVEADRVVATVTTPVMRNSRGWAHGGLLCTLADQAAGLAAMRAVEGQVYATTATLNTNFLRPAIPPLTVEATISRAGRTLVFCDVAIRDAESRLCCTAQATLAVAARED